MSLSQALNQFAQNLGRYLIEPFSFIVDPAVPGQDRYASTHLYDYRHALLCNGLLLFANDSNISAS